MVKTMKKSKIGTTHVVLAACVFIASVAFGVEPPPGVMGSSGWNYGGLNCGCFPKKAGGPPICDSKECNPDGSGGPFPCWRGGGESCDIVCQALCGLGLCP